MKVIWEESDIFAGRFVTESQGTNAGRLAVIVYVGNDMDHTGDRFGLLDTVRWTCDMCLDKEKMAAYLTQRQYKPTGEKADKGQFWAPGVIGVGG